MNQTEKTFREITRRLNAWAEGQAKVMQKAGVEMARAINATFQPRNRG